MEPEVRPLTQSINKGEGLYDVKDSTHFLCHRVSGCSSADTLAVHFFGNMLDDIAPSEGLVRWKWSEVGTNNNEQDCIYQKGGSVS